MREMHMQRSNVHPIYGQIDFETKHARQGNESSPWRREPATDAAAVNH